MDFRSIYTGEDSIDWWGQWVDYTRLEDSLTPTDIEADPMGMLSEYVTDGGLIWDGAKCVLVF